MIAPHVYVHVPFCARRCSYCSFSIAVRTRVPAARYVEGVARELRTRFPASHDVICTTLYLGGGTPSHLGAEGVRALTESIRAHVRLSEDAEITLEANPEDVNRESVREWRASGINRVSLGVQSFDDTVLRWMHRVHSAAQARDALIMLRDTFPRVSADLIFAAPAALNRSLRADIEKMLALSPGHISIYGLTAEQGTPFARWLHRGEVVEATEELYEDEFLLADDLLRGAGYEHYEVSNFARPRERAVHNTAYWTGTPYAGVGPAAHSYDAGVRRWNTSAYVEWQRRVDAGEDPREGEELLSPAQRNTEAVYLGLRSFQGLRLQPDELEIAARWVAAGWGDLEGDLLRLSPLGWLRLDALAGVLTDFRSR